MNIKLGIRSPLFVGFADKLEYENLDSKADIPYPISSCVQGIAVRFRITYLVYLNVMWQNAFKVHFHFLFNPAFTTLQCIYKEFMVVDQNKISSSKCTTMR